MPSSAVIRRIVSLPASANRSLREALSYEIDRLLPLAEGDVYFGFRRQGIDRKSGRLDCALWAVDRAPVDDALAEAKQRKRRIDSVWVLDRNADPPQRLPLANVPLPRRPALSWPPSWGFVGLQAAVLCLLAAAALYLPILHREVDLQRLHAALDVATEGATETRRLQAAIDARLEEAGALYRRAYGKTGGAALLEELTSQEARASKA